MSPHDTTIVYMCNTLKTLYFVCVLYILCRFYLVLLLLHFTFYWYIIPVFSSRGCKCVFNTVQFRSVQYISKTTPMLSCASAKEVTTCCPADQVKIYANGSCVWYREFRLSVSHCEIDITWFPFDNQVCDFIFESRNHDRNELNIFRKSSAAEMTSYSRNGEWHLEGKTLRSTPRKQRTLTGYVFGCFLCV